MNMGQDTHLIVLSTMHEMKWDDRLFFLEIHENPIFGHIFGHKRAKIDGGAT